MLPSVQPGCDYHKVLRRGGLKKWPQFVAVDNQSVKLRSRWANHNDLTKSSNTMVVRFRLLHGIGQTPVANHYFPLHMTGLGEG